MHLQRPNNSHQCSCFQLDLLPKVYQMVWAASTKLVSHYHHDVDLVSSLREENTIYITIFSIQQFNARSHATSNQFLSWIILLLQDHPAGSSCCSNPSQTTYRQLILMLTPFSHLHGVAGGVENHPLFHLFEWQRFCHPDLQRCDGFRKRPVLFRCYKAHRSEAHQIFY